MATSPIVDGLTFIPAMYYKATAEDTNPDCENYEQTFDLADLYSNNGTNILVQCGLCGQPMTVTSATILDPQPEYS
ncbi:hypothetical protein [Streptomyces sp. NPDC088348]|uniref:hypothetical protein n=1 Tax=Streptomyces sp. NPDC088348 TaxID=3365853 RepID=UPI0037F5A529